MFDLDTKVKCALAFLVNFKDCFSSAFTLWMTLPTGELKVDGMSLQNKQHNSEGKKEKNNLKFYQHLFLCVVLG